MDLAVPLLVDVLFEENNKMAKPIILSVDDEIHVLNAIERDLRDNYGSGYQIIKASSGTDALETL